MPIAEVLMTSAIERGLNYSAINQTIVAFNTSDTGELHKAVQHLRVTLVFFLVGFVTIWLLCIGLIWHMRVNRAEALKGDAKAARKVILPAFEPMLIVLSVVNGLYIVFLVVTLATNYFQNFLFPVVMEAFYSGNQFMFMSILFLMWQKSLALPATKRSVVLSFLLSYCAVCYVWAAPNLNKRYTNGIHWMHSVQILPFVYTFIKPPSRATKRVIRELCISAIVFYVLSMVLVLVLMNPKTMSASRYVLYGVLIYVAFCPLIVWRVLKADTEYWRGIGQQAHGVQDLFQRENGLCERVSSEGLHVVIEMNRKHVIDFAYLQLTRQLGVGSMSTVFQGTLKAKTLVAVKTYSPTSCSDQIVAAFSHQAAMCSALNHPNVVKFYGMCVAPPTICLVFQLCQCTLADTLSDQARRQNFHPARQQLLISVGYMLDAARAVAYLHSFVPPFVHRDIKPSSFLVDAKCNVQLSDFGESRSVGKGKGRTQKSHVKAVALEAKQAAVKVQVESPLTATVSRMDSLCSSNTKKHSAEYAAPETIDGNEGLESYGEAGDVYSLGVTMWDILHPSDDKFPGANGVHSQIFEAVLHGVRPRFDGYIPFRLRNLIERSWHCDPRVRPSAKQIVADLEYFQEELSAQLVLNLMSELDEPSSAVTGSCVQVRHSHTFPGSFLVDCLIDRRFVTCPAEAIRMGNALMDSSILHHIGHSRSFENDATASCYFDLIEAELSLPAPLERSLHPSGLCGRKESAVPASTYGSYDGHPRTSFNFVRTRNDAPCQCRQLGQRLVSSKSSRFRRQKLVEPTLESDVHTTAGLVDNESLHLDDYKCSDIEYRLSLESATCTKAT